MNGTCERKEALTRRLELAALNIRKDLLTLCSQQSIHIGGDLPAADVMTVLWQYQMHYDPANPRSEDRDRFILSKGHAAAVTSFNQAAAGALVDAFDHLPPADFDKPTVLICHTVKGRGVDFMENQLKWHAGRLSAQSRDEAIGQLEAAFQKKWGAA